MLNFIDQTDNENFQNILAKAIIDVEIGNFDELINLYNLGENLENPFKQVSLQDIFSKSQLEIYHQLILAILEEFFTKGKIALLFTSAIFTRNPSENWHFELLSDGHYLLNFYLPDIPNLYLNSYLSIFTINSFSRLQYYYELLYNDASFTVFFTEKNNIDSIFSLLSLKNPLPSTQCSYLRQEDLVLYQKVFDFCSFCFESLNLKTYRILSKHRSADQLQDKINCFMKKNCNV